MFIITLSHRLNNNNNNNNNNKLNNIIIKSMHLVHPRWNRDLLVTKLQLPSTIIHYAISSPLFVNG